MAAAAAAAVAAMDPAAQMEQFKKLAVILAEATAKDEVKHHALQSIADSLEVGYPCPDQR